MKKLLVVLFALAVPAFAQQQEMVSVPKSMLTQQQLTQVKVEEQVETISKYAGLGREVGEAINGGLSAVTTHTAAFAKTEVGQFTMFIIAWKVLGKDVLGFLIAVPLLVFATAYFSFAYWRDCMTRRVVLEVDEKKKPIKWETVNAQHLRDMGAVRFCYFALYVVFVGICLIVALA